MTQDELQRFLDEKAGQYNRPLFIETDPIFIPHQFSQKEDIEISAFFAATFAWGQRKTIINKCTELLDRMGNAPYDFVMQYKKKDIGKLKGFRHRTFNADDLSYFLTALQHIYAKHGGLEQAFARHSGDMQSNISHFRSLFFGLPHEKRTEKHVSDPKQKSAAKRLNMFLRWMVRKDKRGVDFGLWNKISPTQLYCPLDVHSGNVARKLGLLERKQNDWQAVAELTTKLKKFDPDDPVKYDFALFGLGVFEQF